MSSSHASISQLCPCRKVLFAALGRTSRSRNVACYDPTLLNIKTCTTHSKNHPPPSTLQQSSYMYNGAGSLALVVANTEFAKCVGSPTNVLSFFYSKPTSSVVITALIMLPSSYDRIALMACNGLNLPCTLMLNAIVVYDYINLRKPPFHRIHSSVFASWARSVHL